MAISLIILGTLGSWVVYFFLSHQQFAQTQDTAKRIAIKVASKIPASAHERITKPEDVNGEDYDLIETYFRWVMDGNPVIDDIYTVRKTVDPNVVTFVVSGQLTRDADGNNQIDEHEIKPAIGEKYDLTGAPQMREAFDKATVDEEITYDKWGSWVSGYAPVLDSTGQTIAAVGVDVSAQYITDQRHELLRSIGLANFLVLPILLAVSFVVSIRVSRTYQRLAYGMDRIVHGDFNFRLPLKGGRTEQKFTGLFNNMVTMMETKLKHKKRDDGYDEESH